MSDNGEVRECPGTTPSECAMMRERMVAGTNAPIPDCPIHGAWTDDAESFISAPYGALFTPAEVDDAEVRPLGGGGYELRYASGLVLTVLTSEIVDLLFPLPRGWAHV